MYSTQPLQTHLRRWLAVLALLLGLSALTTSASITLSEFKATAQTDGSILVLWETATEIDTQAFNLYRATAATGPWNQQVDQQEARGDGFTGAVYQYRDTAVTPGVRYYYLLEELISSGTGQRAGPVNAGVGLAAEPTSTATATHTPTASATGVPATATATLTSEGSAPATVTRQFANTPTPPLTATPGPESTWTPAPTAPATLLPPAQVATPTGAPGTSGAPSPGIEAPTPISTGAVATSVVEPTATLTGELLPNGTPTLMTEVATSTPPVFAAATISPALLEPSTRPAPDAEAGRNPRLILLLGGGAIALAGLLGAAGLLIWRASRPRGEGS